MLDGVRAILTEPGRRIGGTSQRTQAPVVRHRAVRQVRPHDGVGDKRSDGSAGLRLQELFRRDPRHGAASTSSSRASSWRGWRDPTRADLLIAEKRDDINELRDKAAALRARQDEAAALFADGAITASQLKISTAKLAAQLAEVESKMLDANRTRVFDGVIGSRGPACCVGRSDAGPQARGHRRADDHHNRARRPCGPRLRPGIGRASSGARDLAA